MAWSMPPEAMPTNCSDRAVIDATSAADNSPSKPFARNTAMEEAQVSVDDDDKPEPCFMYRDDKQAVVRK
jgi:hypothetical protein